MRQYPPNSLVLFGFTADFERCLFNGLAACDGNFMKLHRVVPLSIGLPTVILLFL
jgi:hypothetical protein